MQIPTILKTAYTLFCNILAPPECAYCKEAMNERGILCVGCRLKIKPIVSTTIAITASMDLKVFSVSAYVDPLKKLILAKRNSDILASQHLGILLWQLSTIRYQTYDYIVPIPLHWMRFADRGFNQAEEIARVLSQQSGVPYINALTRSKKTQYQSDLTSDQRKENLSDAFAISKTMAQLLHGKHVLLVDDVLTTGSTLVSAARVLHKCKPASLQAAVICRVP